MFVRGEEEVWERGEEWFVGGVGKEGVGMGNDGVV